jgi:hypothetical protein
MIQNNSAIDNAGDSTNSWVNATDISVRWHTCAAMADIVSFISFHITVVSTFITRPFAVLFPAHLALYSTSI